MNIKERIERKQKELEQIESKIFLAKKTVDNTKHNEYGLLFERVIILNRLLSKRLCLLEDLQLLKAFI